MCKLQATTLPPLPPHPTNQPTYGWLVNILISIIKKEENFVGFDFRIGTFLVIFSFFWSDNIAWPGLIPFVKNLISIIENIFLMKIM